MDPLDNPLAVQEPPFQVIPNPSPEQQSDLAGQWRNWIANENNRAALMQFGVGLMQPMGFGQNVAGHVGQAIGGVGELASRRQAADLKQQEADSKADLRTAQASVAEARAANAGSGAARAADRLAFERERLGVSQLVRNQQLRLNARKAYDSYKAKADADNALLPSAQRRPVLSFEEWQRAAGIADTPSPTATGDEGDTPVPQASSAPTGRTPSPQAIEFLRQNPNTRVMFDAKYGSGASDRYLK